MSVFDGMADAVTGALGEPVTVTPDGGEAREITAEFSVKPVDEGEFIVSRPVVSARTVDVSDLSDGDQVVARGTSYVLRHAMPDGEGMTDLILQEA